MSKLLPCKCGSDDLTVNCVSGSPKWVECDKCGQSGDLKWTEAEAIAAWNRRAPATVTVTREEVARAMCCPSGCAAQRYGNACRVGLLVVSDVNVFAAADAILALLNREIAT